MSKSLELAIGPVSGFRNLIINGDMRIDQRANGAQVAVGEGSFYGSADRWRVVRTGGGGALQRGTLAPPGFTNSLVYTNNAAVTLGATQAAVIGQQLEGNTIARLGFGTTSAKTITLSFWAYIGAAGEYSGSVRSSSASTRSYVFTFTINAANTWEYKTITIPGDVAGAGQWVTDNALGMPLVFDLGSGANNRTATVNQWVEGNFLGKTGSSLYPMNTTNGTYCITGVQLEEGIYATPFEQRPYGLELLLCQRYALMLRANGVAYARFGSGWTQGTNVANYVIPIPVPLRAMPSLITSGAFAVSGAAAITSFNLVSRTDSNVAVDATSSGLGAQQGSVLTANNDATATMLFSAEL